MNGLIALLFSPSTQMDLRERLPKKPTTIPKDKKKKYRRKNGRPGPKRGPGFYINMKYRKKKAARLAQQAAAQLAQQPAAPAPAPTVAVPQPLPATNPQTPQARKKKPGRKRGPDYLKNLRDRRRQEAAKQAASQVAAAQLAQQLGAPAPAPGKPGRPRGPNYVRNLRWRMKAGPTQLAQQGAPLPAPLQGAAPVVALQQRPKRKAKKAKAQKKQKGSSKENRPTPPSFHPDDVFLVSDRQLKLMEKKAATKPVYRENRQYKKMARNAAVPAPAAALAAVVNPPLNPVDPPVVVDDRAGSPASVDPPTVDPAPLSAVIDLVGFLNPVDPPVAVDDRVASPPSDDPPIDVEDRDGSPSSTAPPGVFVSLPGPSAAADPPIVDPDPVAAIIEDLVDPPAAIENDLAPIDEISNDAISIPSGSLFVGKRSNNSQTWNLQGNVPIDFDDRAGPSAPADHPVAFEDLDGSLALEDPLDGDEDALSEPLVDPALMSLALKPESQSEDSNDEDITDVPGTSHQFAVEDDHDTVCAIDGVDKKTTESIRSGDKEQFLHHLNRFQVASKPFMGVFVAGEEKAFTNQELILHIHENGHNFEEKLDGLRDINLFKNRDGLQMKIPNELNLTTLMDFLPRIKVPVINSYTRGTEMIELSDVARRINLPEKKREVPWNLLSFEMSHTDCRIARDFKEPLFVRENSIVNRLEDRLKKELEAIENQLQEDQTASEKKKLNKEKAAIDVQLKSMPKYQKFLLVTMANSYTDIHVDPSGTCVYYHVKEVSVSFCPDVQSLLFQGRKIFYVAPPTERNLEIYKNYEGSNPPEKWIVEELFDELQRVEIKKGYTAFIPAGFIHAVYTPEDSIVFGGNFLMDGHIDRHFEMTAVEEKALEFGHIEVDNTFPNFENVMWRYTDKVVNERLQKPNPHWKDAVAPLLLRENLDEAKKPNRKLGTKVWYSKTERIKIVGQLKRLHDDYTIRKMREDGATWEEEHEAGQPPKRRKLCRKE
ncbi:hypothetical protein CRE_02897 [Caenorhabditis remanei]|uniref:JmjC domain-containing protein n=1 Tax=Caenorhabditis remanei TaxID=31234 RepID=E3LWJ3_CAERE|nr:hypothetical protein CRE_02897 [Caenorhabditis remanei]